MNSEIRKRKIQELLSKDDLSSLDKKILVKLYLLCKKLDRYFEITKKDKGETLASLEDQIYYIDNKYLNDMEKIKLEFLYYKNLNKPFLKTYVNEIQNIISEYKDNIPNTEIEYLKELIIKLQILTDNKVTFFNSTYKLLDNYSDENELKMIKRG